MEDLQAKYDSLCYATFLNIKHVVKDSTRLNFKNVIRTNEEHLFVLSVANACRGILENREIGVDCDFGDRLKLSKILNCPIKKINKNEEIIFINELLDYIRPVAKELCGEDFSFGDIYHAFYERKA